MNDLNDISLSEIIKLVKSKKISSLDLANHFINNIKKGKKLNSFITTCFEQTIKDSKNFKPNPTIKDKSFFDRVKEMFG